MHMCARQPFVVRIMWMVPIYAIDSWLALRFTGAAIYLDTIRECYEAYVLYNFFSYLLACVPTGLLSVSHVTDGWGWGGRRFLRQTPGFDASLPERTPPKHMFPFCCFKPWPMGPTFLHKYAPCWIING